MKRNLFILLTVAVLTVPALRAYSHCEVPCGIFDDKLRIALIKEHITTIEKSIKQITELSAATPVNYNQIVRWTTTKDDHADEIQHIASQYFITQRIKPVDPSDAENYKKYITQLSLMHELMIYAMKAKQTTDLANIEKMREIVTKFELAYFGEEEHKH